jgi:hypothetical protein
MNLVERILLGMGFRSFTNNRCRYQVWLLETTTYTVLESWFCLSNSQACKEVVFTSASFPKSLFHLTISSAVNHASI